MKQRNIAASKIICEASGCLAAAQEEIAIPVGQTTEIKLSVCNDCRSKFVGGNSHGDQAKTSLRKVANSGITVAASTRVRVKARPQRSYSDQ